MKKNGKILVVDDNAGIRQTLGILLPPHFAEVRLLPSPITLLRTLEAYKPDVVLLDMNFESAVNIGNEGLYWLSEIKKASPETAVVLFTAYADIALAVEGMKRGAFDFIVKPWKNDNLIDTLTAACGKPEGGKCKDNAQSISMFWGASPQMEAIHEALQRVAPTDATILITGENGTGKDMLANEIHKASQRSGGPMVGVDAGAIPETLFEGEFFGYVKGAFTDAKADHAGRFEQADGGTLFLDEIGNIPLTMQAKLLRALQDRSVTRLGDTKSIPVDIRLICATNMDLEAMVAAGRFREDLFYRINTFHFHIPALRERACDIVPLAEMFMARYAEKYRRPVTGISEEGKAMLTAGGWHGNIRELQNCIEKAVILSDGELLTPAELQVPKPSRKAAGTDPSTVETLEEAEEKAIRAAMDRCHGNLTLVANSLGISRPTLYSKLKKYGI